MKENKKKLWFNAGLSTITLLCMVYLMVNIYKNKIGITLPGFATQGQIRATFVKGDVYYRSGNDAFPYWKQLLPGNTLKFNDEIKTTDTAMADISFSDKIFVRLESRSRVRITQFNVNELWLNLEYGFLYGDFNKLVPKQKIIVSTPRISISAGGSRLSLKSSGKNSGSGAARLRVLSGMVQVDALGDEKGTQDFLVLATKQQTWIKPGINISDNKISRIGRNQQESLHLKIQSIYKDIVLIITNKIQFELGKYQLTIDSYPELNKIANIIKQKTEKILIKGYTDSQGKLHYNKDLAFKRAMAIKAYLVDQDISPKMLAVRGYGEKDFVASNKTAEGRQLNRRVEFSIIREESGDTVHTSNAGL